MTSNQLETNLTLLFSQYAHNGYPTSKGYTPRFIRDFEQVIVDEIKALCSDFDSSVVLDVCCGTGTLLDKLKAQDEKVECVGIDIAPGMIEVARATTHPNIRYRVTDAENIPEEFYNFFNVIVCKNSFYFLDPERAIDQFSKALIEGGYLALTVLYKECNMDRLYVQGLFDVLVRPLFELIQGDATIPDFLQACESLSTFGYEIKVRKLMRNPISPDFLRNILSDHALQIERTIHGLYANTRYLVLAKKGGD